MTKNDSGNVTIKIRMSLSLQERAIPVISLLLRCWFWSMPCSMVWHKTKIPHSEMRPGDWLKVFHMVR